VAARAHGLGERPEERREQEGPVPPSPQAVCELLDDDLGTGPVAKTDIRDENRLGHPPIPLSPSRGINPAIVAHRTPDIPRHDAPRLRLFGRKDVTSKFAIHPDFPAAR
jgi:hypothetical protein